MSSKFKSFGNYLKHVIILGCLGEVNTTGFKKPIEEYLKAIQSSILYLLQRPNPVFSLTPFSNYKVISSSLSIVKSWGGREHQAEEEGGVSFAFSVFFLSFFSPPCIPLSNPSFHFGSANIAAWGEEGRRKQGRMKKSVQSGKHSSGWLSERQILLYLVSGKQSKQECTMAGLSPPASPPTCS